MLQSISTLNTLLTRSIKLIIFDKDETIIKSEEMHYAAWKEIFYKYNYILSLKEYIMYGAARQPQGFISRVFPNALPEEIQHILTEKEIFYQQLSATKLEPYEGFIDMFNRLREYPITFAVASSDSLRGIVEDLTKIQLITKDKNPFIALVSREEVKEGKPSPDIFIEAMKRVNITNANDVIVFEDAPSGIQAAKSAKVLCLAHTTAFFSREELIHANADFVIENYNEIIPV